MTVRRSEFWTYGGVTAAVALAAVLRFVRIGHQSFEYDEIVTLSLVHRSFGGMLSTIPRTESTPPLFYVLIWPWSKAFGTSEAGLRSLSALFGTATVPVGYLVGRTMLRSRGGGLVVALLVAVAPVLVWYSQEARSYSLFVFLGALSLLFFARSLDDPSAPNLWGWAVFSALDVATHYFAGFLVLAETLVLARRFGRRIASPVGGVLLVAAALAPLAYHQYHTGGGKWSWFLKSSLYARTRELLERFLFYNYNPGKTPLLVLAVVAAALLAYRGRRLGEARVALLVAAICIGVPIALALIGVDAYQFRNLLVAWLPLAVAIAAGIVSLPAPSAVRAAAVALVAAGLLGCTVMISLRVLLQRGSWRTGVTALRAVHGDRVVMPTDATMLLHYWPAARHLSARGARVSEVDVIGQGIGGPSTLGLKLPAFHLAQALTAGNMTVFRFRAATPELVTPHDLPWSSVRVQG